MANADPAADDEELSETLSIDQQTGDSNPPPPPQPVQRQLGRYQLMLELASGGMATVYLARVAGAAGFEKLVALKRIHAHLAKQQKFTEMFLDEARIASRIGHPNVCDVFDFGEADGTYYIAMEYLLGETVSRLLRKRTKDPAPWTAHELSLITRIVAEAAQGLHAAHELRDDRGEPMHVVHRDVSPQNLFITYEGAVKVVDFGIARARGRIHDTTTGSIKGKYAYMSPEQVRNLPLDRRTDVWALGAVLWEMLTRKRLFRRDSEVDTLMAVNDEPIEPPSSVRSDVPHGFDRIVMGALCREVEDRTPTARQLARELIDLGSTIGPPVTMDDLGEWMRFLFAEEAARRREVVDFALQMGRTGVPRVSAAIFGRDTSDASSVSVPSVSLQPTTTAKRRAARRWRVPMLVGVLVAAFAFAIAFSWPMWSIVSSGAEAGPSEVALAAPADPAPLHEPPPAAPAVAPPEAPPVVPAPVFPEAQTERDEAQRVPRAGMRRPVETTPAPEPPPEEAPTMTTATGEGQVNVVTPGGWWADVYFHGERKGRTPVRITLPAGRQTVTLLPFGEAPERTVSVDVPAGGTARLVVPREP